MAGIYRWITGIIKIPVRIYVITIEFIRLIAIFIIAYRNTTLMSLLRYFLFQSFSPSLRIFEESVSPDFLQTFRTIQHRGSYIKTLTITELTLTRMNRAKE